MYFQWHSSGELHATGYYATRDGRFFDIGLRYYGPQRSRIELPKIAEGKHPRTVLLVLSSHLQEVRIRSMLRTDTIPADENPPVFIPVVWDGKASFGGETTVKLFPRVSPIETRLTENTGIPERLQETLEGMGAGAVLDMRSRRVFEKVECGLASTSLSWARSAGCPVGWPVKNCESILRQG